LPYMKIIGSALLLWIAVQLFAPDADDEQNHTGPNTLFTSAAYIIVLANLAMSLDNVLAVAAAAADSNLMLAFGLLISILIICFGSSLVVEIVTRFPVIYPLCATLIGYLAGNLLVGDIAIKDWVNGHAHWLQSINIGAFDLSVSGVIGAAGVFPFAKLYHFLTTSHRGGETATDKSRPQNKFVRDYLGAMRTRLASARILALVPLAVVIAVTYLGHPVYLYHKKHLLSQISYYGLALGMTLDEVVHVKGRPAYVALDSENSSRQLLIKFEDIPKGRTPKDYYEWEFPIGRSAPASLEIIYSRKTLQVIQIACYSTAGYCLPISGISTGASEDEVMDKLGKPHNVRSNKTSETLDYPGLHLSLLLENKRVTMLMVHNFDPAP
jgi:hypothetical protein